MNRRLLPFLALALTLTLSIVSPAGVNPRSPDPPSESDSLNAADSSTSTRPTFKLSRVDKDVIRELEKAWWISSNGTNGKEGAVLIFQTLDGGYFAKVQRKTNEQKKITFAWVPNAIAIVHTHPNRSDPKPSLDDMKLSDRLRVPMFTISLYGMWVYEPATRKTSLIHQGLDWLDPEKWSKKAAASTEDRSPNEAAPSTHLPSRKSDRDTLPVLFRTH